MFVTPNPQSKNLGIRRAWPKQVPLFEVSSRERQRDVPEFARPTLLVVRIHGHLDLQLAEIWEGLLEDDLRGQICVLH